MPAAPEQALIIQNLPVEDNVSQPINITKINIPNKNKDPDFQIDIVDITLSSMVMGTISANPSSLTLSIDYSNELTTTYKLV